MDFIREALDKANASLDRSRSSSAGSHSAWTAGVADKSAAPQPAVAWSPREVKLNPRHLERNRIVSSAMSDPSHIAFNLLRTRTLSVMHANKWSTVGVTSPTSGVGKTTVAVNLAISLARGDNLKVVLLDLDLKRPAVATALGVKGSAALGDYLRGDADIGDCFIRVAPGLAIGLGGGHQRQSSELLQGPQVGRLLDFVSKMLKPDIVIFDLPPMAVSDDVIAFMPNMDAVLLVAAAGKTTVAQIDSSEQQVSQHGNLMGVVLNKAEISSNEYYY